jgi:predicted dehydrogenase
MENIIRLGVIGLHNHYHVYPMAAYLSRGLPGLQLVSVYDERKDLAEEFCRTYGVAERFDSRDALLKDSAIDAVLVMSDTGSHYDDVLASVCQHKHVLLDKPIAISTEQAAEMVAAAEQEGVLLMMAYLIRYLPAYRKAKEIIENGRIGKPLTMKIGIRCPLHFIRDHPKADYPGWYVDPKRGGAGGFLDHGIHYADTLRFLLGSEPVNVVGKIAKLTDHEIAVDDYGVCIVTTDQSQIVTIESTWHAPDWYAPLTSQEECLIVGTKGEIHIHYQRSPQLEVSGDGSVGREYFDWLGEDRYEICYRDSLLDFAESIRLGRPLSATGVDGYKALRIIEGAYQSSELGRSVDLSSSNGRKR